MQGIYQLVFPPFSESNLFDALSDVLDRIKDVKGKKAVLVLASGIDTFSKMNLDQVMKRIQGNRRHDLYRRCGRAAFPCKPTRQEALVRKGS